MLASIFYIGRLRRQIKKPSSCTVSGRGPKFQMQLAGTSEISAATTWIHALHTFFFVLICS
jgi:hypothetical protein